MASAGVTRAVLDNGLRVVIVPSSIAPVATTQVNYLVGGDETPAGFPGTAHAQEHMMFRGSPGLTAAQLASITAALGGNFDADTQAGVTQYYFTTPAADVDVALHVAATRMRGVTDSEALWKEERGAIEQEVARDLSSPEYKLYTELLAHVFAGTPYATDPLGTRASFDKTTGAMLHEFYSKWYAPNNAILVVTGNVDPAATLARVRQLFGDIPKHPVPAKPPIKLEPLKPAHLSFTTDLPVGLAVVAYRLPGYRSSDWAAAKILSDVLDSRRGDLYALAASGKALDVDFESITLPEAGLGFAVAELSGSKGEALLKELKAAIARYVQHGVPPDLVTAAKRLEVTNAELRKASISGLAAEWSRVLAVEGRDSPDEDVAALERVTPADVNRVARAYLVNDKAVTAVLTPSPSGRPVTAKPPSGGESFAPQQVKPVALPSWAQKLLVPPQPTPVPLPADFTLPNGVRLLVRPQPSVGAVAVYGRIKNNSDVQTPPGQEGVAELLGQLLPYGTTSLDRLAYQKALDGLGATATLGTSFSLQVLPSDFDRAVGLLADGLLHPALPPSAFSMLQKQLEEALPALLESPAYLADRAQQRALYPPGDPARREVTPASVAHLKLEDVRQYHAHTFRPDLATIVVIGRISPDEARAAVEKHFGSWKAVGPKPVTEPPPAPPNAPSVAAVPDASRVQDKVTLVQNMALTRLDPDYYPLTLGDQVLAGGFYASRLFRDLREKTGLVYSVGVELNAGRSRSTYAVEYACDPANVAKARAIAVRDLREMQKTPLGTDVLERTRALLIRQIPLAESSFSKIAYGLLDRSLDGLPLDEPDRAAKRYLKMTAAEVQAAFAKRLRPDDLVQVTLGPVPP